MYILLRGYRLQILDGSFLETLSLHSHLSHSSFQTVVSVNLTIEQFQACRPIGLDSLDIYHNLSFTIPRTFRISLPLAYSQCNPGSTCVNYIAY